MTRRLVAVAILVAMSAVVALAHGGHVHKIMGIISKVEKTQVQVQGTDGKQVIVVLNDKTQILKGTVKAALIDLKEGTRVVIEAEGEPLVAKTLRLGAAPATKKS
jgi:predicted metalloprotease